MVSLLSDCSVWPLIALNLEFKLRPVEEAPAEAAANT
jgi:hypothetical protein